jgi:hypothetical protein
MKKLLFGLIFVTVAAIFYLLTCFAYWQFPVNFAEWSIGGRATYAFAFITFGDFQFQILKLLMFKKTTEAVLDRQEFSNEI